MSTYLDSGSERRAIEDDRVVAWRLHSLTAAGFDDPLAAALAEAQTVDLHALIDLVERGCPPELAARILAPLDGDLPNTGGGQ